MVLTNILLKHWRCPQSQATSYKTGMFFRWQKAHPIPAITEPQVRHRYPLCWEAMEHVHPQLTAEEALSLSGLATAASSKTCGCSPPREEVLAFLPSPPYQCVPWQQVPILQVTEERKQRHVVTTQCFSLIHLRTSPRTRAANEWQAWSPRAGVFHDPGTCWHLSYCSHFHLNFYHFSYSVVKGTSWLEPRSEGQFWWHAKSLPSRQSLKHKY